MFSDSFPLKAVLEGFDFTLGTGGVYHTTHFGDSFAKTAFGK